MPGAAALRREQRLISSTKLLARALGKIEEHKEVEEEGRIFDHDLRHYEGDHLVFRPKGVTAEQVFEVRKRLMRSFYSWRNIGRRWWRLMRSYWGGGKAHSRVFGTLVVSFVLFELSVFQRHHAKQRVFPSEVPIVPPAPSVPQVRKLRIIA